jgi:hypothetical protein
MEEKGERGERGGSENREERGACGGRSGEDTGTTRRNGLVSVIWITISPTTIQLIS